MPEIVTTIKEEKIQKSEEDLAEEAKRGLKIVSEKPRTIRGLKV